MAINQGIIPINEVLNAESHTDSETFAVSGKTTADAETTGAKGSILESIAFDRRPVLRGTRENVARAAALLNAESAPSAESNVDCPEAIIAMRRLTLEEMSRFENLQLSLQETLSGSEVQRPPEVTPSGIGNHRWAYAFQSVAEIASLLCGIRPSPRISC